jgi:hypothetical protein
MMFQVPTRINVEYMHALINTETGDSGNIIDLTLSSFTQSKLTLTSPGNMSFPWLQVGHATRFNNLRSRQEENAEMRCPGRRGNIQRLT